MFKFTRISSVYPEVANIIENEIRQNNNLNYKKTLNKVFSYGFGEKNNLSKELSKKNYKCEEIISNIDSLQKKWTKEFLENRNDKNILLEQIKFYKSNIIYFNNYSLMDKKLLFKIRKLKHVKLIIVFHCSPINLRIAKKLKLADILVTCTDGYKNQIHKMIKKKCYKICHAFNASNKNYENFKKRNVDIAFIGSLYVRSGLHINRINLIFNLLKSFKNSYIGVNFSLKNIYQIVLFFFNIKLNLSIFEKSKLIYKIYYIYKNCNKPIYGKKMINILSKSKILINTHIEDTKYAGNMRLFEGTAAGCMVITDNKLGLKELFIPKKEVVIYNNVNDLLKKINHFLKNMPKLISIANKGKRKTILHHSYRNRAKEFHKIIHKNLKYK